VVSQIGEIASKHGWRGSSGYKVAEPSTVTTMPVVDQSDPSSQNVRTSIDCYVSGQYVGKKGQVHEVRQRYTIFVSYSKATQYDAMQQTRNAIASDFSSKYGKTFNITTIFVPETQFRSPEPQPAEMYRGSTVFKNRFDRARYELGTEKVKYQQNTGNIRRRYNI